MSWLGYYFVAGRFRRWGPNTGCRPGRIDAIRVRNPDADCADPVENPKSPQSISGFREWIAPTRLQSFSGARPPRPDHHRRRLRLQPALRRGNRGGGRRRRRGLGERDGDPRAVESGPAARDRRRDGIAPRVAGEAHRWAEGRPDRTRCGASRAWRAAGAVRVRHRSSAGPLGRTPALSRPHGFGGPGGARGGPATAAGALDRRRPPANPQARGRRDAGPVDRTLFGGGGGRASGGTSARRRWGGGVAPRGHRVDGASGPSRPALRLGIRPRAR